MGCVCARERERVRETGNAIVLIPGYVWTTIVSSLRSSAIPFGQRIQVRISPSVYPQAVCKRNRDGDGVNGSWRGWRITESVPYQRRNYRELVFYEPFGFLA